MKIQLSVEESLAFQTEQGFWNGFAAGAHAAAEQAKEAALRRILEARPKIGPQVVADEKEG